MLWYSNVFRCFGITLLLGSCAVPLETSPEPAGSTPVVVGADGEIGAAESSKVIDEAARGAVDAKRLEEMVALLEGISEVPLYTDNGVELLIDGPETYAHMLEAIKSAQRYIMLEMYIFADDKVGQRFSRALIDKQQAGVQVFVIYDSIGSGDSDPEFFSRMETAGIAVVEHNVVNPVEGGNPLTINNRDHRKILVVDGEVGYVGGINLSSTYSSISGKRKHQDPLKDGWRDSHLAIHGPAVDGLQLIFRDNWDHADIQLPPRSEQREESAKHGNQLVALLHSQGVSDEVSNIYVAYQEAMRRAQSRIWVTQAYFAPDEDFMETLKTAAGRGVDVRLVLPGVSDVTMILDASRSRYGDLLEAGIRIYETEDAVLHAKTAVIDGVWSTVGSSNLDYRSFLHNDEVNAVVLGQDFGRVMEAQFRKDLANCNEVILAQWQQRPLWRRLNEMLAWTLEYWL